MGAAVLERIGNTAKNRDPTNDHRLCVFSSRNNTILTFTRPSGTVISWTSGGRAGFKKVQRSSYEAGYACALKIFEEVKRVRNEEKIEGLHVLFKGFGQGREAVFRALLTSDGALVKELVTRLTDTTPIKIGGTRAKKARRL
ncbi:translational machinery component [Sistotremastrum niveocremeum HHB9708]|nr:translational machinery component [Sistotremastrum niveocremeum HHB9708]